MDENRVSYEIRCKPHIKKYLMTRYGDPADFSYDPGINKFFLWSLRTSSLRNIKSIDRRFSSMNQYSEAITVLISTDKLYRFKSGEHRGCLSNQTIIDINSFIDDIIKRQALVYIKAKKEEGVKVATAIRQFQTIYNITEDEWPFDTIIKYYQRNYKKANFYIENSGKIVGEECTAIKMQVRLRKNHNAKIEYLSRRLKVSKAEIVRKAIDNYNF